MCVHFTIDQRNYINEASDQDEKLARECELKAKALREQAENTQAIMNKRNLRAWENEDLVLWIKEDLEYAMELEIQAAHIRALKDDAEWRMDFFKNLAGLLKENSLDPRPQAAKSLIVVGG